MCRAIFVDGRIQTEKESKKRKKRDTTSTNELDLTRLSEAKPKAVCGSGLCHHF